MFFSTDFFMYPMAMGIEGAAIATVIGQAVSALLCVAYLPHFKAFKIRFYELIINLHIQVPYEVGTGKFS